MLANGTTYYVKIAAKNAAGLGDLSAAAAAAAINYFSETSEGWTLGGPMVAQLSHEQAYPAIISGETYGSVKLMANNVYWYDEYEEPPEGYSASTSEIKKSISIVSGDSISFAYYVPSGGLPENCEFHFVIQLGPLTVIEGGAITVSVFDSWVIHTHNVTHTLTSIDLIFYVLANASNPVSAIVYVDDIKHNGTLI